MSDFHSVYRRQLVAAAGSLFDAPAAPSAPAAQPAPAAKLAPAAQSAEPARGIGRRRHVPLLVAIALGALLLAAAALAATQIIGFGNPVPADHPLGRERPSVTAGIGVPVSGARGAPASTQRLAISAPDPAGGLPWGLRVVRTTRGLLCLQVGRLLDGRLGILGQDGEFDDDGLFHELPASALEPGPCIAPSVWTILSDIGVPAAGALTVDPTPCRPPWLRAWRHSPALCPAGDERLIGFGVLGPHAVSVSYVLDGHLHTVATAGSHGAYLIVLRVPPKLARNAPGLGGKEGLLGGFPIGAGQGEVVARIEFSFDGRLCQTGFDREPHGPPQCKSRIARAFEPVPRALRGLRTTVALKARRVPGGYDLVVAFPAPAAVRNASIAYGIQVTPPSGPACGRGGQSGQSIERDVARGQVLHFSEFIRQPPGCHGVVRGQAVVGGRAGALHLIGSDQTIGRFSFRLP
jgi:hypothetical protein